MPDTPSRTRRRVDYLGKKGPGPSAAPDAAPTLSPAAGAAPAAPASEPPAPAAPAPLPFAAFAADGGWERAGEYLYRRRVVVEGGAVDVWPAELSPEAGSAADLCFYDTETTGLSGGAGSVIFLFGAARCEGRDLHVEQLFLSDFPGEADFLMEVRRLLAPHGAFVSYNGKSFDSHLLRTRFLMNRIDYEMGSQVDLLHHARRLWRSITGDCSLQSIERGVLGISRGLDVAGEDIPIVYLEFLRSGAPGLLPLVFDHNVSDVTSLARIYALIGAILGEGGAPRPESPPLAVDERSLGSWLLGRSPDRGRAVLASAYGRGNREAGFALSLDYKRRGEWERAAEIWGEMTRDSRSLAAAVELAKYLEHRRGAPAEALRVVETALSWGLPMDARACDQMRRRRERLQARVGRAMQRRGGGTGK